MSRVVWSSHRPTRRRVIRRRRREPSWVPGALALVGLVVAMWLLLATGVPDRPARPATTCADRVVWHGARLSDC